MFIFNAWKLKNNCYELRDLAYLSTYFKYDGLENKKYYYKNYDYNYNVFLKWEDLFSNDYRFLKTDKTRIDLYRQF